MTAVDAAPPDVQRLQFELDESGFARLPGLLDAASCTALAALFEEDARFRATVEMERHGFGRGRYRYFARPLPDLVQALRVKLYSELAQVADAWAERLGEARRWPADHAGLEAQCAAAGQIRPTPLLLRYRQGDYNRLHQDLYGPLVFPLQVIVLLSRPGEDFEGGELVLVEQKPRSQSRPIIVPLSQGDAAVVPVRDRPGRTARGWTRFSMRHGVSTVWSGSRHSLGIIFHDAA